MSEAASYEADLRAELVGVDQAAPHDGLDGLPEQCLGRDVGDEPDSDLAVAPDDTVHLQLSRRAAPTLALERCFA